MNNDEMGGMVATCREIWLRENEFEPTELERASFTDGFITGYLAHQSAVCDHPLSHRQGLSPVDRSEICNLCGAKFSDPPIATHQSAVDENGLKDENAVLVKKPQSCNRHKDCDAADRKIGPTGAEHCYDDDCEDCFGR